jgi:hypothetical protein
MSDGTAEAVPFVLFFRSLFSHIVFRFLTF